MTRLSARPWRALSLADAALVLIWLADVCKHCTYFNLQREALRAQHFQRDVYDFGAAVQAWVKGIQRLAVARGVMVRLEGVESLGLVAFHASTLRRAVLNLVQNALDAMPTGGTLTLVGQDTAPGTAPGTRYQERYPGRHAVVDLRALVHPPNWGGTGLGLYIVQEIVAAHARQVTVQSVMGQSTTFTITLPRAAAEAPARPATTACLQL